jgi:hypothetical protein
LAVRGGGRRVDFHAIASGLGPIARRRDPASAGNHLTPGRSHYTVMKTAPAQRLASEYEVSSRRSASDRGHVEVQVPATGSDAAS